MGYDISPEIVVDGLVGYEMKLKPEACIPHGQLRPPPPRDRLDRPSYPLEPRHGEHIQIERVVREELAETHRKFWWG